MSTGNEHANLVTEDGTILVTIWGDGTMTAATRPDSFARWGPPIPLFQENGWQQRKIVLSETERV